MFFEFKTLVAENRQIPVATGVFVYWLERHWTVLWENQPFPDDALHPCLHGTQV